MKNLDKKEITIGCLKPFKDIIKISYDNGKYFYELMKIFNIRHYKNIEIKNPILLIGGVIDWNYHSIYSDVYYFKYVEYDKEEITELLNNSPIIKESEIYIYCYDNEPIYSLSPRDYCKIWEEFDRSTGSQGYVAISKSGKYFWEFFGEAGYYMVYSNFRIEPD